MYFIQEENSKYFLLDSLNSSVFVTDLACLRDKNSSSAITNQFNRMLFLHWNILNRQCFFVNCSQTYSEVYKENPNFRFVRILFISFLRYYFIIIFVEIDIIICEERKIIYIICFKYIENENFKSQIKCQMSCFLILLKLAHYCNHFRRLPSHLNQYIILSKISL